MSRAIFLGAGASPGVPSISCGWGACNPKNPKNIRRRTSTFYEVNGAHILIDTSPDLRQELLDNHISQIDGVCYTHAHSDHLHGIDELREINRLTCQPLDIYAVDVTMDIIQRRFSYLFDGERFGDFYKSRAGLIPHLIAPMEAFEINGVKIVPLRLLGHNMPTFGYVINDEIVHVADFKTFSDEAWAYLKGIRIKLLVLPLTIIDFHQYHIGLKEALAYIDQLKPEKVVLNHMASECDYDYVNAHTPENTVPAYDNLKVEW